MRRHAFPARKKKKLASRRIFTSPAGDLCMRTYWHFLGAGVWMFLFIFLGDAMLVPEFLSAIGSNAKTNWPRA